MSRESCRVCTWVHAHTLQACLYSTFLSCASLSTLLLIPMLGGLRIYGHGMLLKEAYVVDVPIECGCSGTSSRSG